MALSLMIDGHAVSLVALVALGVLVGFVAGMFGVGGGFLLTPLLNVAFGVPFPIAVGSGLCQMVGTALAALLRHRDAGQGEPRFDLTMLAGSLMGVHAGARALDALAAAGSLDLAGHSIPVVTLVAQSLYASMLIAVAAMFWRQGEAGGMEALQYVRVGRLARVRFGPTIALPAVPLRDVSAIVIAAIGLGLGFLSGLLGIGGGVALMPVLIYGFGFPIRHAAGTGIIVLVATSIVGTVVHALRGHVHLGLSTVLMIGASVSAQFGAMATRKLPTRVLRRAFSLVLLVTVVAIAWDLVRRLA